MTTLTGSYNIQNLQKPGRESARLVAQANTDLEEELAQLKRVGLRSGARVLDLGCGTGTVAYAMSKIVGPSGLVVGLDRSRALWPAKFDDIKNMKFVEADLTVPKRDLGSFDLIYGRFFLQHVPDPSKVLSWVSQLLKPGGCLVLLDSDDSLFHIDPPDPELQALLHQAEEAQAAVGGDRRIGMKLPGLLSEAGLNVVKFQPYLRTSLQMPFAELFRMGTGYKASLIGEVQKMDAIGRRLAKEARLQKRFLMCGAICAIARRC